MKDPLGLYLNNHENRGYTMIGLFREVKKKYDPVRVLYPGSYIHITPSLVFSDVTYIDSFRDTNKFFISPEIEKYIRKHKEYNEQSKIKFYHQDYRKEIPEEFGSFDLVISQYGGFVGQAVKKYLKNHGYLLCNDSHGDATLSSLDPDYELKAVYRRYSDEKFTISTRNLEDYLIPKNGKSIDKEFIIKTMKGIPYTKSPTGYIFKKK